MHHQRALLFLLGCIPARLALAYAFYRYPTSKYLAVLAAVIGIGFLVIFVTGARRTGPETFGEEAIWWNSLRVVHGSLYLIAAFLAWSGSDTRAWAAVATDAAIGLLAFIAHHGLQKGWS